MSRKPWKPQVLSIQEDALLVSLVEKHGSQNWKKIAAELRREFRTRNFKQCRDRWRNHLNSTLTNEVWTPLETQILFEQHQSYGNMWVKIAKSLPGRSENDVKNHFYSTVRKNIRKVKRDSPNDKTLDRPVRELLQRPEVASRILDYQLPGIYKTKGNRRPELPARGVSAEQLKINQLRFPIQLPPISEIRFFYADLSCVDDSDDSSTSTFEIPESISESKASN